MKRDSFFTKLDWAAFWTATLATCAVYFPTLGPSVGLEDSGELATAAAHLGVPHPPGYPFWTLCSWIFCKLFSWVTYMGHPTPAWAVSCCSAVFGALAAGCTAMLICRSSRDFIGDGDGASAKAHAAMAFGGGVAGALTFALSPVEWSQSTIVEIYSLNALFLMWVFLLSYRWMRKPSDKILWFTAFVFGLGLTNYQVLLFAVVPLALIIMMKNLSLFRDVFIYLVPVALVYQLMQIGQLGAASVFMQRDVIDKHIPVGISEKLFGDDLLLRRYGYETFKDLAEGRGVARRMLQFWKSQHFSLSPEIVDGMESHGSYNLAAHTSACPSTTLIALGVVLVVAAIVAAAIFKRRGEIAKAAAALKFCGLGGAGAMALSLVFATEARWEGARLEIAPLIEPRWYAAIGALAAASCICAAVVAILLPEREDAKPQAESGGGIAALWRDYRSAVAANFAALRSLDQTAKKWLYGALACAALAVIVALLAPKAGAFSLTDPVMEMHAATQPAADGRMMTYAKTYQGPAYPWMKSTCVFAALVALLAALAARTRRGLMFALPVAALHIAAFTLLRGGAMNGLTHPASWWFCWPIAWNFVLLALAWLTLPNGRSVAGAAFFAQLGVSFYAYMPVVSDLRNPPMNWGYPRTWEGFKHAIMRGQYEAIGVRDFAGARDFFGFLFTQIKHYCGDVRLQFTDAMLFFLPVPFAAGHWLVAKERRKTFWQWMGAVAVCFLMMSILLILLANVRGDIQDGFIQKVKFISSHAMIALWIGYGLTFAGAAALLWKKLRARRMLFACAFACIAILTAFIAPIVQNYTDEQMVFELGGSEQNGHTFGWQFGAYQLDGAKAIREQLVADEEPLPDPSWPPPMEPGAIFFGGTDPGRFVPTYMIYSALYRPDVYLITQNALADDTYMSVERDLYGDEIWIPSKEDSGKAFAIYDAENTDKRKENGKLQVEGALNVMKINGILAKMMFEHDRLRRAFYVEESYAIPWMYPYLSPHGLIMKLNASETPYNAQTAAKDRDFWDWYMRRLLADPMYRRDFAGQKSFSKLRAAIGGLYLSQSRRDDAARAYREAVLLYPASPEAVFRYMQEILVARGKFDEALDILDYTQKIDPNNQRLDRTREFIEQMRLCRDTIRKFERPYKEGKLPPAGQRLLARCYEMTERQVEAAMVWRNITATVRDPEELRHIANLFTACGMFADAAKSLARLEALAPKSSTLDWLALAKAQSAAGKEDDAKRSIETAMQIDRATAERAIRE